MTVRAGQALDQDYLVATLSRLARVPTDVPLGYETLIAPDDPKLVHYVQEVMRPELLRVGAREIVDAPLNNLIVQLGRGETGRSLLIQNYTPAQHHNLMPEPFSGRIANVQIDGRDERVVYGQGVSQAKAHQAVMLTVLKALVESETSLRGRLYWAINNEGRSSHDCSNAILDAIAERPSFAIIQIDTGLSLSLGNRGRADIEVTVTGKATHSSSPEEGLSAIEGAHEVIQRLKSLSWPDRHPVLGGRQAIVYKVRYEPLAPHTLPERAFLTIDRRLLPGDDPAEATAEIRHAIGDLTPYQVQVEQGVTMLPAFVDADDPGVTALHAAHTVVTREWVERRYGRGAFDAGGPCARGVPTVMYGAGGDAALLETDLVPVSSVLSEAQVLTEMIVRFLS